MSASTYDKKLLTLNSQCIIYVDEVNSPTGYWWGTVILLEPLTAKITGGKFDLNDGNFLKPKYSNEKENQIPSLNYKIYPDNPIIREVLFKFLKEKEKLDKKNEYIRELKEMYTELIISMKTKEFEEDKA